MFRSIVFRSIVLGVVLPLTFVVPAQAVDNGPSNERVQQPSLFSSLFRGTEEDQAACRPDVMRLCQGAVPDTFRVLFCLKQQRAQLSRPCLAVLQNYGQ